jgi:hypothetical protein
VIGEQLSSVKKIEESLLMLKRSRKADEPTQTAAATVTDEDKIRKQLYLDVLALGEQVGMSALLLLLVFSCEVDCCYCCCCCCFYYSSFVKSTVVVVASIGDSARLWGPAAWLGGGFSPLNPSYFNALSCRFFFFPVHSLILHRLRRHTS